MRSLLAFVLCCAASFAVLHAQDTPDAPNPPPSMVQRKTAPTKPAPALPLGRITGTVFCADTHRPARGALIMLSAKPGKSENHSEKMSRVGMDGSYEFEHISPGEYAVVPILPGYLDPFSGMTVTMNQTEDLQDRFWKRESEHGTVIITANEAAKFDIELQRGAAISGHILYSDGAPAAQIVVQVEDIKTDSIKPTPNQGSINLDGVAREVTRQPLATDDVGRFRLSGLHPGTYRVVAVELSKDSSRDDFGNNGIFDDPQAVRVYAGDTLHRKAAKTYDLRAGDQTTGIDITIPIGAFHSVRGHVSSVDGRSINMADLKLVDPDDDAFSMSTKLQEDGSFEFPSVPAGTYTLTSKNARIGEAPATPAKDFQDNDTVILIPKTAFGDSTQSIVVADVDLADVNISLTEVPMPKPEVTPN